MRRLLEKTGVARPGLNYYALRHNLETIGGETGDQVAVDAIMGHAPPQNDVRGVYRERISDERLKAVTDYVRRRLSTGVPKGIHEPTVGDYDEQTG